jgi:hypothetical protein
MLYEAHTKILKPSTEQAVCTTQGRLGRIRYNAKRASRKQQPSPHTRVGKCLGRLDNASRPFSASATARRPRLRCKPSYAEHLEGCGKSYPKS